MLHSDNLQSDKARLVGKSAYTVSILHIGASDRETQADRIANALHKFGYRFCLRVATGQRGNRRDKITVFIALDHYFELI